MYPSSELRLLGRSDRSASAAAAKHSGFRNAAGCRETTGGAAQVSDETAVGQFESVALQRSTADLAEELPTGLSPPTVAG